MSQRTKILIICIGILLSIGASAFVYFWPKSQNPSPYPRISTKEVRLNIPTEISFDPNGSKLINRSTRFGVNGVNELKLPDGTPADGINIIKYPTGTFAVGPVARKMAIEYVQQMFQKYGQRPDGGAGKQLVIYVLDEPLQNVLFQTPEYQYFAEKSGETITATLSLKQGFSVFNDTVLNQVRLLINGRVIQSFLNGTPEGILSQKPTTKPQPSDLEQVLYPSKLSVYAR